MIARSATTTPALIAPTMSPPIAAANSSGGNGPRAGTAIRTAMAPSHDASICSHMQSAMRSVKGGSTRETKIEKAKHATAEGPAMADATGELERWVALVARVMPPLLT